MASATLQAPAPLKSHPALLVPGLPAICVLVLRDFRGLATQDAQRDRDRPRQVEPRFRHSGPGPPSLLPRGRPAVQAGSVGLGLHVWRALSQVSAPISGPFSRALRCPGLGGKGASAGRQTCPCCCVLTGPLQRAETCMDRQLAHVAPRRKGKEVQRDSDLGGGDMGHRPSDSCLVQGSEAGLAPPRTGPQSTCLPQLCTVRGP